MLTGVFDSLITNRRGERFIARSFLGWRHYAWMTLGPRANDQTTASLVQCTLQRPRGKSCGQKLKIKRRMPTKKVKSLAQIRDRHFALGGWPIESWSFGNAAHTLRALSARCRHIAVMTLFRRLTFLRLLDRFDSRQSI
jgi:hypothetical protein